MLNNHKKKIVGLYFNFLIMKKNMLLGAAALAGAGLLYKMHKDGKLDKVEDKVTDFAHKAKKEVKNVVDAGKNEAGYIKDRAEYTADKIHKDLK